MPVSTTVAAARFILRPFPSLLAVAKLSQPVTKDFTKEALIRVKLDY